MAQKKAHEVDSFLKGSVSAFTSFLVYGPDRGLVSERASLLAGKSGVDISDPFNVTKLDNADIQSDSLKIFDEINSVGLFGGKRLVWIKAGGNDKTVVEAINAIDADPPKDMVFLVEAGDLKKSASLRKAAESAVTCMALPCYGDDGRSIKAMAFRQAESPLGLALLGAPKHRKLWLAGRAKIDDWASRPAAELHIDDAAWAE